MSLRIRRGTDAQRQQITPDEGELIFTTNTQKLYLGDGVTQGGINIGQTLAGTGLVFDSITQTLQATGSGGSGGGINSVSADLNPALGGNLNLNSRNITGTGNISINGSLSVAGLGANLVLNSYNITGTGNINTTGTLGVSGGLSRDLSLNSFNLVGTGNINTTGTLGVSGGLSRDLALGGYAITGTGNINTTGTLGVSGGLSRDLSLNSFNLVGTGNINTTGSVSAAAAAVNGTLSAGATTLSSLTCSILNAPDEDTGLKIFSKIGNSFAVGYYNGTYTAKTPVARNGGGMVISLKGWTGSAYQFSGGLGGQWDSDAVLTDNSPKSSVAIFSGAGGDANNVAILDSKGVWSAPLVQTTVYSVATTGLPSAVTSGVGARAFVLDATSSTFTAAYTGGGANKVPVYSDGAVWRIG
jgi:hypothetical protein